MSHPLNRDRPVITTALEPEIQEPDDSASCWDGACSSFAGSQGGPVKYHRRDADANSSMATSEIPPFGETLSSAPTAAAPTLSTHDQDGVSPEFSE